MSLLGEVAITFSIINYTWQLKMRAFKTCIHGKQSRRLQIGAHLEINHSNFATSSGFWLWCNWAQCWCKVHVTVYLLGSTKALLSQVSVTGSRVIMWPIWTNTAPQDMCEDLWIKSSFFLQIFTHEDWRVWELQTFCYMMNFYNPEEAEWSYGERAELQQQDQETPKVALSLDF